MLNNKPVDAVKNTVIIGINAAIFIILSCFAFIPIGLFNVNIETSYAFLVFASVIFGPVAAFWIGILGHTIKDLVLFGNLYWNWVFCSGIFGFLSGLFYLILDVKHSNFTIKKNICFLFYQVLINFLVWGLLAPISDYLIYYQPIELLLWQGGLAVSFNVLAYSIIGMQLIFSYSRYYAKKESLIKRNYEFEMKSLF